MTKPTRKDKVWNANNMNDWWAIKAPEGFFYTRSTERTKSYCIKCFCPKLGMSWRKLSKLGYRAVKIRIVEME